MFQDYDFSSKLTMMGLSNLQIEKTKEHIEYYYGITDDSYIYDIKVKRNENASFFISLKLEDDYNDYKCKEIPVTILIDESGNCVELDYPIANYINKDIILVSKESEKEIQNTENDFYFKEYIVIEKQAIINSKGDVLYEGELGDIDRAQLVDGYLLLEKSKYTELQIDQIKYYLENCIPERYDYSDYIECPKCGSDAEWNDTNRCYVCEECGERIIEKHISEDEVEAAYQKKVHLLELSNFETVFDSEEIKQGRFITDSPDEREEREMELDRLREMEDNNDMYNEDNQDEYDFVRERLYSVYDICSKKVLFPFQPCKIKINPSGMPKGIYLGNERDLTYLHSGFKFEKKMKSFSWLLYQDPFGETSFNSGIKTFNGQMFISIYDTFRTGPHTGLSLKQVFEMQPRTIIKYVSLNHIFISSEALQQLGELFQERYKTNFANLIIARDSKLSFSRITSINDKVFGRGAYEGIAWYSKYVAPIICTSLYCDKTFYELFLSTPQYVIGLALLNDGIEIAHEALSGIESLPRYDELVKIVKRNNYRQEEREQQYWSMVAEDMDKEIIELGLATAFEGNPDLMWNID
jgi:hypothetical protein